MLCESSVVYLVTFSKSLSFFFVFKVLVARQANEAEITAYRRHIEEHDGATFLIEEENVKNGSIRG